jgi:predicted nucleotidyltransferase
MFSERNRVSELAVFGSALGEDFGPDSDVDILVTFFPNAEVSLFDLVDMADELSVIVGRRVDLVPKHGLKRQIRQPVLESAHVLYAAAHVSDDTRSLHPEIPWHQARGMADRDGTSSKIGNADHGSADHGNTRSRPVRWSGCRGACWRSAAAAALRPCRG